MRACALVRRQPASHRHVQRREEGGGERRHPRGQEHQEGVQPQNRGMNIFCKIWQPRSLRDRGSSLSKYFQPQITLLSILIG